MAAADQCSMNLGRRVGDQRVTPGRRERGAIASVAPVAPRVVIIGAGFGGLGRGAGAAPSGHHRRDDPRAGRRGGRGLAGQHLPRRGLRRAVPALLLVLGDSTRRGAAATRQQPEILDYLRGAADREGLLALVRTGQEVATCEPTRRPAPGGSPPPTARRTTPTSSSPPWASSPTRWSRTCRARSRSPGRPSTPPSGGTTWLAGKRVAVIGTGASAIQFVPGIVDEVGAMTVFQRSAPYVVAKPDRGYRPHHHRPSTASPRCSPASAASSSGSPSGSTARSPAR